MTTLITFIGRAEANRAYARTRYRFEDGHEVDTQLFAIAAFDWLRRSGRPPTRWVLVGTATSGWDVLLAIIERFDKAEEDAALDWASAVTTSLATGPVTRAQLDEFQERFSGRFGVELRLELADNDGDAVFDAIARSVEPGASVVLDITHSFRTMPTHALVALGALRWLRGVEIADIVYGAFEERDKDKGVTPARSLESTARLARFTPALAQLSLVDDVGQIAPFYGEASPVLAQQLAATQRLESIMQFDPASSKRGQALGILRDHKAKPISNEISGRLIKTLESLNQGSGSFGLLSRAKRALERGDFMRAVGLANEAIALKAVECFNLREIAVQTASEGEFYRTLNDLVRERLATITAQPDCPRFGARTGSKAYGILRDARNSVMHAGAGIAGQSPPNELLDEAKLTDLLKWSFRFYDFIKQPRPSA